MDDKQVVDLMYRRDDIYSYELRVAYNLGCEQQHLFLVSVIEDYQAGKTVRQAVERQLQDRQALRLEPDMLFSVDGRKRLALLHELAGEFNWLGNAFDIYISIPDHFIEDPNNVTSTFQINFQKARHPRTPAHRTQSIAVKERFLTLALWEDNITRFARATLESIAKKFKDHWRKKMRYRTNDGQEYIASDAHGLLEAMRRDSRTESESVLNFMVQLQQRCQLQSGVSINISSPETCVNDLLRLKFLELIEVEE